jgi:hypothetical protein
LSSSPTSSAISHSGATLPTDAGTEPEPSRAFRDRPLGRIAILLAVLLLAFLATRTCASRDTDVDQDEAVEIARNEVDYDPDRVIVRFVPQGVESRPFWAVSLSTVNEAGFRQDCTTVLVNGSTGDIERVEDC